MSTPVVLDNIDDLSVDWLSEVLSKPVDSFTFDEIVGEGYASRMYRLRLVGSTKLPESLILKLATVQETQRELMDPEVFCREVSFYRGIGRRLPENMLPTVHFAAADKQNLQLTLLLEDLGEIPHKPWREGFENSCSAVRALARIHATYWGSEEILQDQFAPVESEMDLDGLLNLLRENLEVEQAAGYEYPYLRDCALHTIKLAKWMVGESDRFHGAMTLVHGDFHNRNIHFTKDRTIVFDWQVTERGRPVRDLIYWMLLCVDVGDIKEFKPQLIELYLTELEKHGVRYKRSSFLRDFNESMVQSALRIFCYQTLVSFSEEDRHEIENFLDRTESMAKVHYIRAQLRVARVILPPIILFLKLIGKR